MEQVSISQEHFKFEPISSNAEKYFVPHSGVFESYQKALSLNENFLGGIYYIYGPKGSGKSHLSEILIDRCLEFKIPSLYFRIDSDGSIRDMENEIVDTSSFISRFQEMKAQSGLLVVESEKGPHDAISDSDFTKPHIVSRLLSGELLKVGNPQEEELRTILIALLERHHLRLKDSQLDLILARVPAIPEYFRVVSEALTELVPRSGKLRISALKNFLEIQR